MSTAITENEWCRSAEAPMLDIAHILIELDTEGHIPENMRKSIHRHACNALSTLPGNIGSISAAMASALSGDCGLSDANAASASWGIAAMADNMRGMYELEYHFGASNKFRTEASKAAG